ncbi:hypothetical protein QYF36_016980 [Acer negundo]|nr:hypothetical protein QYF36_016980 [Acer negundo]
MELVECEIIVTLGGKVRKEGGEMYVREVTMQMKDMEVERHWLTCDVHMKYAVVVAGGDQRWPWDCFPRWSWWSVRL